MAPEEEQRAKETMEEGQRGEALSNDGHAADTSATDTIDREEGSVTVTSVQAMFDRRQSVPSQTVVR
jgi:hypothetical protein